MTQALQARPVLSVVVPVYDEAASLPVFLPRLEAALGALPVTFEAVLVDDHSSDETAAVLKEACRRAPWLKYLRLAHNRGSHIAILAGMAHAQGDCCVFLAADLQDPPELIGDLVSSWREGSEVVWAERETREGLSGLHRIPIRLYHSLLGLVTAGTVPPRGADFALLDRKVVKALLETSGMRLSIDVEIARLGFRQTVVGYTKRRRERGRSKWTLARKLDAVADAMILTRSPLLLMWAIAVPLGVLGVVAGAAALILSGLSEVRIEWPIWVAILVTVLLSTQLFIAGVVGEYLSRILGEARRPPLFVLQESMNFVPPPERTEADRV